MPLWLAALMFAVPSALATVGLYVALPAIQARTTGPILWWYLFFYVGPLALMVPAAYVAARLEGTPPSWRALADRLRLRPLRGRDWLWVLFVVAVGLAANILLASTAQWLASTPLFTPPPNITPAVDPRVQASGLPSEVMGVPVAGNWLLVVVYFLCLIPNIVGEECYMRGIILARQEVTHGRWAWLIHGTLWTLFHFFQRWTYLQILPVTLATSYVVSRTKNTTIGVVAHFIGNAILGWVPIILAVAGVGVTSA
jgi:hypothetical protein